MGRATARDRGDRHLRKGNQDRPLRRNLSARRHRQQRRVSHAGAQDQGSREWVDNSNHVRRATARTSNGPWHHGFALAYRDVYPRPLRANRNHGRHRGRARICGPRSAIQHEAVPLPELMGQLMGSEAQGTGRVLLDDVRKRSDAHERGSRLQVPERISHSRRTSTHSGYYLTSDGSTNSFTPLPYPLNAPAVPFQRGARHFANSP